MIRDLAVKAIDDAFADAIRHLYSIHAQDAVQGASEKALLETFKNGLVRHLALHAELTKLVEAHFA